MIKIYLQTRIVALRIWADFWMFNALTSFCSFVPVRGKSLGAPVGFSAFPAPGGLARGGSCVSFLLVCPKFTEEEAMFPSLGPRG